MISYSPAVTISVFIAMASLLFIADVATHKRGQIVTLKSSVVWSLLYISGALCFASFLYFYQGAESASLFMTGYTLEKVLAFDNLFVFSLIFAYFKISSEDRHSALHWGILGAVIFRLIFVFIGVESLAFAGRAMELIFAAVIAFTVYLIVKSGDDDSDYNNAWYVKYLRSKFPMATPFFIAVCVIEISDVMFAFDSVPAVIAVTKDPVLIYSSMIFAILGLRSMYFVIDALSSALKYMNEAIICVLCFISAKLAASALLDIHIGPTESLSVILSILSIGVILSLVKGSGDEKQCTKVAD